MDKQIWDYSVDEIAQGYTETDESCVCLLCGAVFKKHVIYTVGDELYDALGALEHHIADSHGSTADWLLKLPCGVTGITQPQSSVLALISAGKSDKEVSAELKMAESTVRSYRFKLREKEKQAKLYSALMQSLKAKLEGRDNTGAAVVIDNSGLYATQPDDRYDFTEAERSKTLKTYFDENGALKSIPAKAKKQVIVLSQIVQVFKPGVDYNENEVNKLLLRIYENDHVSLRRALIEYGFMTRTDDGTIYNRVI